MSQVRFHVDGMATEWINETIVTRQQGIPTAVAMMSELRPKYPLAAIRIERRGDIRIPNPVKLFRFNIDVKKAMIQVKDGDGVHLRTLKDTTVQSRPFNQWERDKVEAEIKEQFPEAILTEVAL